MDRKEMARILDEWMVSRYAEARGSGRLPRGRNLLKSYIIEANILEGGERNGGIKAFFANADLPVSVDVFETDDPTLQKLEVGRNRVEFFLDTLDTRFWLLHTTATADAADSVIRSLANRTRLLDSTWLPSTQLETWSGELGVPRTLTAKFSVPTGLYREDLPEDDFLDDSLFLRIGATGDARLRWRAYRESEALAPSLALWAARIIRREHDRDHVIVDDVSAAGKLTCRGTSFRLHEELLHGLKNRYAALIKEWEQRYRLEWVPGQTATKPSGTTANLNLPQPLEEPALEKLLDSLSNCGEPYRLYGVPIRQGTLRYIVKAVDLHTGDKVDFEMGPDLLRVYLYPSTCGNVLARLLTNLQHYHDARVELE